MNEFVLVGKGSITSRMKPHLPRAHDDDVCTLSLAKDRKQLPMPLQVGATRNYNTHKNSIFGKAATWVGMRMCFSQGPKLMFN